MKLKFNPRNVKNGWYPQTNSDFVDDVDGKSWKLYFGLTDEQLILFGEDSSAVDDYLNQELEPSTEYSGFPMLDDEAFQRVLDYLLHEGCIKIEQNGMHLRLVADFEGK